MKRGDMAAGEAVEKELDAFIERWARDARKMGGQGPRSDKEDIREARGGTPEAREPGTVVTSHPCLANAHRVISKDHKPGRSPRGRAWRWPHEREVTP